MKDVYNDGKEKLIQQIDKAYMDWFEKMIDEELAMARVKFNGGYAIGALHDLKSKLKQEVV